MGYRRPFDVAGFRSRTAGELFTMMQSNRDWLLAHLEPVPDELLWKRPIAHKNSIGNLLWHIAQAERDWIVHWIDGQPFPRDREREFSADLAYTRKDLLDELAAVRTESEAVLRRLEDVDLDRPVSRPGYSYTVKRALLHVIQHEAYHVGQVVYLREALLAGQPAVASGDAGRS
ncbi:MAG TPA: DinB family protein [Bacillota bacterium]